MRLWTSARTDERRSPAFLVARDAVPSDRPSTPGLGLLPGPALREVFRKGYGKRDLAHDLVAGLVVAVVALPLSMALAISAGVAPQYGLYTAIIAGGLVPLLGGARTQVTGPTAAFVVILAPISARYGLGGLLLASMMAGAILVVFGVARLGRFIEFIPHPVTTGFTAGIATVIAMLQLKDFLGLSVPGSPEHFLERVVATVRALPSFQKGDLIVGLFTLLLLLVWPRVTAWVPSALIALPAAAVLAILLARFGTDIHVATIASRFHFVVDGQTSGRRAAVPSKAGLALADFRRRRRATRPLLFVFQGPRPQCLRYRYAWCHRVPPLRGGRRWDDGNAARPRCRAPGARGG